MSRIQPRNHLTLSRRARARVRRERHREKKKLEKKKQQESRRLAKKRRLDRVLSALGLLDGFRALPAHRRAVVVQSLPSRPVVVIDPADRGRPDMKSLKAEIEGALEGASARTSDGQPIPLLDIFSICPALALGFSNLEPARLSLKRRLFVNVAEAKALAFFQAGIDPAHAWLEQEVMMKLLDHSRMDGGTYGCVADDPAPIPGWPVFRLTLSRSAPREVRVEIDGQSRPAFQCVVPAWCRGIEWLQCDGEVLGLEKGRQYPVYIQSHGLRRLRERLPAQELTEAVLQIGLRESLADPLVKRRGDAYWFEYRLRDHRVGYLIARLVQDKVVFTTYLFLTMEGTPEARLLKEKLGLCRKDKEYVGLDRMETFLSPDILRDEELVRVLEECDCGPLLQLAREGFQHNSGGNRAETVRRFLCLPGRSGATQFSNRCSPVVRGRRSASDRGAGPGRAKTASAPAWQRRRGPRPSHRLTVSPSCRPVGR
jgi:hypothetical protein